MKLISMTDFVFMLRNRTTSELCKDFPKAFKMPEWNGDKNEMVKKMLAIDAIQWRLTGEYAKFLKQPLKLGMFVPCDDEDNILKEPKGWTTGDCDILDCCHVCKCEQYKKYKEKVYFKDSYTLKIIDDIVINKCKIIEDLLKLNLMSLELTDSAIKQIGL